MKGARFCGRCGRVDFEERKTKKKYERKENVYKTEYNMANVEDFNFELR